MGLWQKGNVLGNCAGNTALSLGRHELRDLMDQLCHKVMAMDSDTPVKLPVVFFVSCLILGCVFAFVAWECPSAMAVLLRPDPGGCTKTPLLWGRHCTAAGGHGEWSVEVPPWSVVSTSIAGRAPAPPLWHLLVTMGSAMFGQDPPWRLWAGVSS